MLTWKPSITSQYGGDSSRFSATIFLELHSSYEFVAVEVLTIRWVRPQILRNCKSLNAIGSALYERKLTHDRCVFQLSCGPMRFRVPGHIRLISCGKLTKPEHRVAE